MSLLSDIQSNIHKTIQATAQYCFKGTHLHCICSFAVKFRSPCSIIARLLKHGTFEQGCEIFSRGNQARKHLTFLRLSYVKSLFKSSRSCFT